jgi:hypothetical protein
MGALERYRKYLWKDEDGVNRWHDDPKPTTKRAATRGFGANGWSTGLESDAASVHSSQVNEFRVDAQKHGFTGVEFSKDGTAKFMSRQQRTKYLRHRGLCDRDAGYGDPPPRNY